MKRNRLHWLLAVAAVLLLLRWFAPLQPTSKAIEIVLPNEPNVKSDMQDAKVDRVSDPAVESAIDTARSITQYGIEGVEQKEAEDARTGKAFATRSPPVPEAPPPPNLPMAQVQAAQPLPVAVETVASPPPSPPPLQVIGTWDDGVSPGVFVSTPHTTELARKDSVLLSDYRVVSITAGAVSLLQMSSQATWLLVIPQNAQPANAPNRLAPKPSNG